MLSVIKKITEKPKLGEKKEKIICITAATFSFAAFSLFCVLLLDISIVPAVLLFLLIGTACVKFGLYKFFMNNSPLIHICCLIFGCKYGIRIADTLPEEISEAYSILCLVSAVISYGLLAEIFFGIITSLFGSEFEPKFFAKNMMVCTPLFFTTELYLVSETFFFNHEQLYFSFVDFGAYFIFRAIAFSIVTSLILCSVKEKFYRFVSKLFTGVLLCVYAQYMFMNKDLPTSLGDKADWDSMHGKMLLNAVIWVVLLLLPFAVGMILSRIKSLEKNDRIKGINCFVSVFLGGIQLVSLVTLIISNPEAMSRSSLELLSGEEQFVVSENKNIITFIIDQADQKYFEDAYTKMPDKFDCLKDFTYYTNTAMVYDSTNISIPQMLTAARVYPEHTLNEWYETICGDEPAVEFYSRLKENNYKINIFADFTRDYETFNGYFDNTFHATSDEITIQKNTFYADLSDMSVYRYAPLALKRFIEPTAFGNNFIRINNPCVHDNCEFAEKTDLHITGEGHSKNYFIVQHLVGTHGVTGTHEKEEADCLTLLDKYFGQLKELGLYDDSVIIVTADHGEHNSPDNMPIFYIKQADERHDSIQYSSAPIYHTDYAATVLEAVGLYKDGDEKLFGRSIFRIDEDEKRERVVFQRYNFTYAGEVEGLDKPNQDDGVLLGYTYTGTKEDLKKHELNDPPDIVIKTEGY